MQISLTQHAEELLREALARNPGRSPEEILEQALAERSAHEAAPALAGPVWERLKSLPGIKLPHRWPPHFKSINPLRVEGELPSERLIRERR
jgi:hypothetical protein